MGHRLANQPNLDQRLNGDAPGVITNILPTGHQGLKAKDLIQEPPITTTPEQLPETDLPEEEILSDQELDDPGVAETTRNIVPSKSILSDDERRLGEEAFLNALIELEALGQTSPPVANKSAENHDPNQDVGVAESLTSEAGSIDLQETESSNLQNETSATGNELAPDDDAVPTVPCTETAIEVYRGDANIPPDVILLLKSDSWSERCVGLHELAQLGSENGFEFINRAFDDQSEEVRNAAALALFNLHPDRAASFARILREGSPERRGRIGAALASSGLADIVIDDLSGQTREQGYEAFSLLFLMTKAGEVEPLLRAIEDHPSIDVRLTVVRLLTLNGRAQILPVFRQLAVSAVLPSEVRAAVIEAIYELGRQIPRQI